MCHWFPGRAVAPLTPPAAVAALERLRHEHWHREVRDAAPVGRLEHGVDEPDPPDEGTRFEAGEGVATSRLRWSHARCGTLGRTRRAGGRRFATPCSESSSRPRPPQTSHKHHFSSPSNIAALSKKNYHPLDDGEERRFYLLQGYRCLLVAILAAILSNEALEICHAVQFRLHAVPIRQAGSEIGWGRVCVQNTASHPQHPMHRSWAQAPNYTSPLARRISMMAR